MINLAHCLRGSSSFFFFLVIAGVLLCVFVPLTPRLCSEVLRFSRRCVRWGTYFSELKEVVHRQKSAVCGRIFGSQHGPFCKTASRMCIVCDADAVGFAVVGDGMNARHLALSEAVDGQLAAIGLC